MRLPVLLRNGVIPAHHDGSVGTPIRSHPQMEKTKIDSVGQHQSPNNQYDNAEEDPPQPVAQVGGGLAHDARL